MIRTLIGLWWRPSLTGETRGMMEHQQTEVLAMSVHLPDRAEREALERREMQDITAMREALDVLGGAISSLDQPVSPQMAAGAAASSRARRAIGDEFGWLTASEASRLLGSTQPGGAYANDQRKNHKALGVPVRNTFAYPGFQFTESGQVHPTVRAVLRSAVALEVDADTVAQWFCLPSAGLDDVRPVDILSEDEAVLADFNGRFGAQW